MREINDTFTIVTESEIKITATHEIISYANHNKKERRIEVAVEKLSANEEIVTIEFYTFEGDKYINDMTENQIWANIDAKRME